VKWLGKYGQVAVKAAKYVQDGYEAHSAWTKASCEVFILGSASQLKGCPKSSFLGLYGSEGKNAEYAKLALEYLKSNPDNDVTPGELWSIIMEGTHKKHNQQMDVVLALYKEGLV
jgi:hypothetical protein